MIYTVTLNPSIDYIVRLNHLEIGSVNRSQEDFQLPGGKGINVSRILNQLGIPSTAWGYLGGFTGRFIEDRLQAEGIVSGFVPIQETTRINVKLKAEEETEINGAGPAISPQEQAVFSEKLEALCPDDLVILSGSKPQSLPADYYQQVIAKIKAAGASFVIDTTGAELVNALPHHPLVVKPNHHELADIYGFTAASFHDLIPYGKKLIAEGAQFAIVSLAAEGALFFDAEGVYHGKAPAGTVKNSVGAGDSMIAGFSGTYLQTKDPLEAFRISLACGSATAFADDLARKEAIEELIPKIQIRKLEEEK